MFRSPAGGSLEIYPANRSSERYTALEWLNESQRNFPLAAESIHRKQYWIRAETQLRSEVSQRLGSFPSKEQNDSSIYGLCVERRFAGMSHRLPPSDRKMTRTMADGGTLESAYTRISTTCNEYVKVRMRPFHSLRVGAE